MQITINQLNREASTGIFFPAADTIAFAEVVAAYQAQVAASQLTPS